MERIERQQRRKDERMERIERQQRRRAKEETILGWIEPTRATRNSIWMRMNGGLDRPIPRNLAKEWLLEG